MEEPIKPSLEGGADRLREINERAERDARAYLEKRMRQNLFGKSKDEEGDGAEDDSYEPALNMEDASQILKEAFDDLKIQVGSQDYLNYMEQFVTTTGLGKPKK